MNTKKIERDVVSLIGNGNIVAFDLKSNHYISKLKRKRRRELRAKLSFRKRGRRG